nr:MAG TPA: hypothetical protein [Caudoviricetes sp.]
MDFAFTISSNRFTRFSRLFTSTAGAGWYGVMLYGVVVL